MTLVLSYLSLCEYMCSLMGLSGLSTSSLESVTSFDWTPVICSSLSLNDSELSITSRGEAKGETGALGIATPWYALNG